MIKPIRLSLLFKKGLGGFMVKTKETYCIKADVLLDETITIRETKGIAYLNMAKTVYDDKNYQKAAEYYLKAGEAGEATGHYELGGMHSCSQGIKKDFAKALNIFKRLQIWEARAHQKLGMIYEYGHERPQDIAKAKEHDQKAVELGDFVA
ncbi:tetratricopeptide repeat protein [Helicobacter heilmannii]|nr:SEL1-like repeat protein [Helicobacter heilmannii]